MSKASETRDSIIGTLLIGVIYGGGVYGWIWNIVKMFQADWSTVDAIEIWRIIGFVFAPLGAILGYF